MTSSERLKFGPLLCYSIGNVTLTAIYGFLGSFLLKYYTDYVRLDPALIGWALLVRSIVDAAIDPVIGYMSDRTELPQGRRRPYFLIGTIPAAAFFYLLMTPPADSQFTIFVYLMVISSLMVGFLSLMGITHLAMGFELTNDYDERTRIFGFKNLVENLTILIAMFSVPLALEFADTTHFGHLFTRADCYRLAAGVLAIIASGAAMIAYFGTTESPHTRRPSDDSFSEGLTGVFKNRPFVILLIVFVLVTIADRVIQAELFIVLEQFHGLREEDSLPLLVGFFIGGLISVWPWVMLAQRFGKDVVLRVAIGIWPLTCIAFVGWHWSMPALCAVAFGMGAAGTGMLTILGAMVPDVLECDNTNQCREGMYVSVGNVVYQIAMGIGFLIAGQTLHIIGYQGDAQPVASTALIFWLRVTFATIPVLLLVAALAALRFFPLTRRSYLSLVENRTYSTELACAITSSAPGTMPENR